MPERLTHLDPLGRARMVDVTPKDPTHRRAIARGRVYMQPETTSLVARGSMGKGDVLNVARVAGIQAAKRTADLIPLCHPLLVGSVLINFHIGRNHARRCTDHRAPCREGGCSCHNGQHPRQSGPRHRADREQHSRPA